MEDATPNGKPILSLAGTNNNLSVSDSIVIDSTNGVVSLRMYQGSAFLPVGGVACEVKLTRTLFNMSWAHIVWTYDTSNWIRGYIDGVIAGGPAPCFALNNGTGYASMTRDNVTLFGSSPLTRSLTPLFGQVASFHYWPRALTGREVAILFRNLPRSLTPAFIKFASVTLPPLANYTLLNNSVMMSDTTQVIQLAPSALFNDMNNISITIGASAGTVSPNVLSWSQNTSALTFTYTPPNPPLLQAILTFAITNQTNGSVSPITVAETLFLNLKFEANLTWFVYPARIYPTETAYIGTNISAFFGYDLLVNVSVLNKDALASIALDTAVSSVLPSSRLYSNISTAAWQSTLLQNYTFYPNLATYKSINASQEMQVLINQIEGDIYAGHYIVRGESCNTNTNSNATLSNVTIAAACLNHNLTILPLERFNFFPNLVTELNNSYTVVNHVTTILVNPTLIYRSNVTLTIRVTAGSLASTNVYGTHWLRPNVDPNINNSTQAGDVREIIFVWNNASGASNFTLTYTAPPQAPILDGIKQLVRMTFAYAGDNIHANVTDTYFFVNDVFNISIGYGDTGVSGLTVTEIPLSPQPFSPRTYSYVPNLPRLVFNAVSIRAWCGTPNSCTALFNGEPMILDSQRWSNPVPVPIGVSTIMIESNMSSNYFITVTRVASDLTDVSMKLFTRQPFVTVPIAPFVEPAQETIIQVRSFDYAYNGANTGNWLSWLANPATTNLVPTAVGYLSGSATYYIDTPYHYSLLNVSVTFATAGSVFVNTRNNVTGNLINQTIVAGNGDTRITGVRALPWISNTYMAGGFEYTNAINYNDQIASTYVAIGYGSRPFPIYCGLNFVDIMSTVDGNYTVVVRHTHPYTHIHIPTTTSTLHTRVTIASNSHILMFVIL